MKRPTTTGDKSLIRQTVAKSTLTGRRRQQTDRQRGGQSSLADVVAYFDRYMACDVFRHN